LSAFSGLNGALTGLYAQRRGMDVTGQNIANANTDGYSRQRVDMQGVGGSPVPAMFATSDVSAGGVTVSSVTRVQDAFLEARGRIEHAQDSYLSDQNRVYTEVQQAFNEPSDTGVQSQLADVWASWHDLSNNPGDAAVRTQVIARATTLADTLHSTHSALGSLFTTTREQLNAYATDVNTAATQVARLNQAIVQATNAGLPSNDLADQRDTLVMHLSDQVGATALPQKDGSVSVFLAGSNLVNGNNARQVAASGVTRLEDVGTVPAGTAAVSLNWADGAGAVSAQSGQLASVMQTLNTILPHYSAQLDGVAANLASAVNAQHVIGYDTAGVHGGQFFASSDGSPVTASNIIVAISTTSLVAASLTVSATGGGTLDGTNADLVAKVGTSTTGPDQAYRQLIADLGVAGQTADRQAGIQSSLTNAVDSARQAQSGVNVDEEMTNLISYQRAYQAAARVLNTIDSTLDTLINHTGS
jgi:flagellar hook-associated protein 1 FlgK